MDIFEKDLKKNEFFIDNQRTHNEIGFVEKGLIKGFYIDDKGNEINTSFLKSMKSLYLKITSSNHL